MRCRTLVCCCALFAWLCCCGPRVAAQDSRPAARPAKPEYRLIVVIVIDQLRPDLLTRFSDLFVEGGFKRLMNRAAWFTNCRFQGATITAPGHATIATGTPPSVHGIVGNQWFETSAGGMLPVFAITDASTNLLGLAEPIPAQGASPKQLECETVGDLLKMSSPNSRVVSCSLKDRAAILLGGKKADGAYWYHFLSGRFVTSSYYHKTAPNWLKSFNDENFVQRFANKQWQRLLPAEEYDKRCRKDDAPYEQGMKLGWSNAFPHSFARPPLQLPHWLNVAVYMSPHGNELLFAFAERLMQQLQLGRRDVMDMLLISLSSNDAVGHTFGPFSHEVMDITLRTDRQLAAFFDHLDAKVGLDHCLIALTSDHGVSMIPEYAIEKGLSAGRLDALAVTKRAETALVESFGPLPGGQRYVAGVSMPWLTLGPNALKHPSAKIEQLETVIKQALQGYPGLSAVFSESEIRKDDFVRGADKELRKFVKNGYFPGRSGQFYLHITENWYTTDNAAGHGSAHDYDRHVPLFLMGPTVQTGRFDTPCTPAELPSAISRHAGF